MNKIKYLRRTYRKSNVKYNHLNNKICGFDQPNERNYNHTLTLRLWIFY